MATNIGFEPFLADPAMLASLQNTLTPAGVLSQWEAEQARRQQDLAAQTKDAAGAAATAETAYTGAAAAPPPQLDPLAQMLPMLFGNVASTLTQDKSFSQRAHENLKGARDDLMRTRMDNLVALKDTFDRKAVAAQAASNFEVAEKSRTQSEKLAKTLDVMLKDKEARDAADRLATQEKGDTERTRMNNETQIKVAEINARGRGSGSGVGPDGQVILEDFVSTRTMSDGRVLPFVNVGGSNLLPKNKDQLSQRARAAGIPVLGATENSSLMLLETVQKDMDFVTGTIIPLLPPKGGAARVGPALRNRLESAVQMTGRGEQLAAYPAIRTAAIKTIQALASLGKGLRINQAEINAAMNFDYPRITDSQETAKKKFEILGMMMNHIEGAAMGEPPSRAEVDKLLAKVRQARMGTASDAAAFGESVGGSGTDKDKDKNTAGNPDDKYRRKGGQ